MAAAPWLVSLSFMWFGWGALGVLAGTISLYAGTVLILMLAARERSPGALLALAGTWSLGWLPALVWQPWLLLAPAALVAGALAWRHRRRTRYRAAAEAFYRTEEAAHR